MSTPEDPGQDEERWKSQGWQSEWQRPGGWRRDDSLPGDPPPAAGWQQAPEAQWTGGGFQRQTHGKSTASLVFGILGLVLFCPIIFSILALIFGYQARRDIDTSGGRLGGRGNATAGIVLGWVGVGLLVLFVVLVIIGLAVGDSSSGGGSAPVSATPA